MVKPGDVVTVDFPGALGVKRRPAVVISTDTYHTTRPDVILGLLTSQTAGAIKADRLYSTRLVCRRST
jgi:mRNA interferase MazF